MFVPKVIRNLPIKRPPSPWLCSRGILHFIDFLRHVVLSELWIPQKFFFTMTINFWNLWIPLSYIAMLLINYRLEALNSYVLLAGTHSYCYLWMFSFGIELSMPGLCVHANELYSIKYHVKNKVNIVIFGKSIDIYIHIKILQNVFRFCWTAN